MGCDKGVATKRHAEDAKEKSKSEQLNNIWVQLHPAMEQMFVKGESLSYSRRMELYSLVHNFCTTGGAPPAKYGRYSGPHIKTRRGSLEHDLYAKIEYFLDMRVKSLEPSVGIQNSEESILDFYVENADKFFKGTTQLDGICQPLNRKWLANSEIENDECEFHRIEHLANMRWKKGIFEKLGPKVTSSILNLIQREREGKGQEILTKRISAVTASLVKIGYDPKRKREIENHCAALKHLNRAELERIEANLILCMELSFYHELFEKIFLEDSEKWFKQQVNARIGEYEPHGYAVMVLNWTNEECNRARRYLHKTTKNLVLDRLIDVAITKQADKFFASVPEFFTRNRITELDRGYENEDITAFLRKMHELCRRSKDNLSKFQEAIRKQISLEINERMQQAFETKTKKENDAEFYIRIFKNTQESFKTIFEGDKAREDLSSVIHMGITEAFKKNYLTEKHKAYNFLSESMFVHHMHLLLVGKKKKIEEVESACISHMKLFDALPHHDGFEKFYCSHLSQRIVDNNSISNELEMKIINEIKNYKGFEFVGRMNRLYQEGFMISPALVRQFKESVFGTDLPFSFEMAILPSGPCSWNPDTEKFNVPQEFSKVLDSFASFFVATKPKGKLHWLHSRSKGELQTRCFEDKKKYILCCTAYQMAVMFMYNNTDSHTFEHIMIFSGLASNTTNQVVQQLVKSNLLLVEKNNSTENTNMLQKDDVIKLNLAFTSEKVKIMVNAAVREEQKEKDKNQATKQIEFDQEDFIKCAVVRVMKSERSISHQKLMSQVISDVSKAKGLAPVNIIKKVIEQLISEEYIARDANDRNLYTYIA